MRRDLLTQLKIYKIDPLTEFIIYDEGDAMQMSFNMLNPPPLWVEELNDYVTYKCIYQHIDTAQISNHVLIVAPDDCYTILLPLSSIEEA